MKEVQYWQKQVLFGRKRWQTFRRAKEIMLMKHYKKYTYYAIKKLREAEGSVACKDWHTAKPPNHTFAY